MYQYFCCFSYAQIEGNCYPQSHRRSEEPVGQAVSGRKRDGALKSSRSVTTSTVFEVDYDYIQAMGLRLEAGRPFDRKKPTDPELAVIVNESFLEMMQWQVPLGKHFKKEDTELAVIGVAKDFNYRAVGFVEVERF